jgi:hypothetical protein
MMLASIGVLARMGLAIHMKLVAAIITHAASSVFLMCLINHF